jgi:hypothetical protein
VPVSDGDPGRHLSPRAHHQLVGDPGEVCLDGLLPDETKYLELLQRLGFAA